MHKTSKLKISNMNCGSCVMHIENDVRKMDGINKISVNFADETAAVEFDDSKTSTEGIINQIKKTGYQAQEISDHHDHHAHHSHHDHAASESKKEVRAKLYKVIFGAAASIIMIALSTTNIANKDLIMFMLTTTVLLYTAKNFYTQGIPPFILRARPNMDTLVALGISVAYIYSTYNIFIAQGQENYFMDATMISTFIMLGKFLEAKAKGNASAAIQKLINLGAKKAHKLQKDHSITDIDISEVKVGDLLLVKPGEKVPIDGIITGGTPSINESMITGESIPADKNVGSKVIGATLNNNISFTMKAEKIDKNTVLAQMVKLVEEAQTNKAPIQKLVDKISSYFVWGVVIAALLTFTIWYTATTSLLAALTPTIAVLIIACPCALGLATPIAIIVGSGKGASMGILLKNAAALEKIQEIDTICFDKTGTITEGKPKVTEFHGKESDLQYLAAIENHSEHPIAKAIIDYANEKKIKIPESTENEAVIGSGIKGQVEGKSVIIGKADFLMSEGIKIDHKIKKGQTILFFAIEKDNQGFITIQDTEKENAKEAIQRLHQQGIKQ